MKKFEKNRTYRFTTDLAANLQQSAFAMAMTEASLVRTLLQQGIQKIIGKTQ